MSVMLAALLLAVPMVATPAAALPTDDTSHTYCEDDPIPLGCIIAELEHDEPICSGTGETYHCDVTYRPTRWSSVKLPGLCTEVGSDEFSDTVAECGLVSGGTTFPLKVVATYDNISHEGETVEIWAWSCFIGPGDERWCERWSPGSVFLPGE